MRTRRALKTAIIWNTIFCIACLLSMTAMAHIYAVPRVINSKLLGTVLAVCLSSVYVWVFNPIPLIVSVRAIKIYRSERKTSEACQSLGRERIWVYGGPLLTTAFWILGFCAISQIGYRF